MAPYWISQSEYANDCEHKVIEHFKPGLAMTLFVAFFLPLLIFLGSWQLDRGAFKRQLETQYLDKLTVLPIELGRGKVLEASSEFYQPFTRVRLSGKFADEAFLLDNQIHDGVTGYWVYSVFETAQHGRFLVNRGFLPGAALRDSLPTVPAVDGAVTIVATVWPDLGLPPIFAAEPWAEQWPKRIQRRDLERMAIDANSRAVELRLESGQPGTLVAAPFAQKLSDLKHRGYALTWFGLTAALIIAYTAYGIQRARQFN